MLFSCCSVSWLFGQLFGLYVPQTTNFVYCLQLGDNFALSHRRGCLSPSPHTLTHTIDSVVFWIECSAKTSGLFDLWCKTVHFICIASRDIWLFAKSKGAFATHFNQIGVWGCCMQIQTTPQSMRLGRVHMIMQFIFCSHQIHNN